MTDLQKTKAEAEEEKKVREAEAEELKRKGEEAERRAAEAEERLRRQSDYEAVKRDLAIMRSVEFPGEDGGRQEEGDEVSGKNINHPGCWAFGVHHPTWPLFFVGGGPLTHLCDLEAGYDYGGCLGFKLWRGGTGI